MNEDASNDRSQLRQPTEGHPLQFRTTQWSLVLSAGHDSRPSAQAALEQLCRTYWYPLYAFLRRSGHHETDAEDLIQSFFVSLIEHDWLATAEHERGRFRSFLLVCLKRFMGGEVRKAAAQKRGGRTAILSLEDADAAQRYAAEKAEGLAPDEVYDRRWALTLLEQAWDRLREECQATGKLPLFEHLRATQDGGMEAPTYAALAAPLSLTESALKSALFRLRARYREVLRQEVAQTVSDPRGGTRGLPLGPDRPGGPSSSPASPGPDGRLRVGGGDRPWRHGRRVQSPADQPEPDGGAQDDSRGGVRRVEVRPAFPD